MEMRSWSGLHAAPIVVAERVGELDLQSLAVQSVGVLIGSPSLIVGKLP